MYVIVKNGLMECVYLCVIGVCLCVARYECKTEFVCYVISRN